MIVIIMIVIIMAVVMVIMMATMMTMWRKSSSVTFVVADYAFLSC